MKDHESVLIEKKRDELVKERWSLLSELFKRAPLKEKVHTYVFSITFVSAILFGVWLVGYIVYALVFKRSQI